MSQMKVELIDSMGDDLRVANIARVSFAKWKEEFDASDAKLIDYLAAHEHSSPFRHTCITLRITAPIAIARQLVKHQVGMSWNEVSRRYVSDNLEIYQQEFRRRPEGGIKQGSSDAVVDFPRIYLDRQEYTIEEIQDAIVDAYYRAVDKDGEYRIAPECARGVLPLNLMTTWIWTGSLTAFFHMYRLRSSSHAQKEVREIAKLCSELIEPIFPHCWKALKQ